ncbi:MAG: hypothetical protein GX591_16280 [Planctomycetes bacterium]|nr:hypothetical protein [Planctomycetota bacterium]
MTQMNTPGAGRMRPSAESDIYTVLVLIGLLSMLIETIYVGYRAMTLFGSLLPPGVG